MKTQNQIIAMILMGAAVGGSSLQARAGVPEVARQVCRQMYFSKSEGRYRQARKLIDEVFTPALLSSQSFLERFKLSYPNDLKTKIQRLRMLSANQRTSDPTIENRLRREITDQLASLTEQNAVSVANRHDGFPSIDCPRNSKVVTTDRQLDQPMTGVCRAGSSIVPANSMRQAVALDSGAEGIFVEAQVYFPTSNVWLKTKLNLLTGEVSTMRLAEAMSFYLNEHHTAYMDYRADHGSFNLSQTLGWLVAPPRGYGPEFPADGHVGDIAMAMQLTKADFYAEQSSAECREFIVDPTQATHTEERHANKVLAKNSEGERASSSDATPAAN